MCSCTIHSYFSNVSIILKLPYFLAISLLLDTMATSSHYSFFYFLISKASVNNFTDNTLSFLYYLLRIHV